VVPARYSLDIPNVPFSFRLTLYPAGDIKPLRIHLALTFARISALLFAGTLFGAARDNNAILEWSSAGNLYASDWTGEITKYRSTAARPPSPPASLFPSASPICNR
jgi:hypothetical protein